MLRFHTSLVVAVGLLVPALSSAADDSVLPRGTKKSD